MPVDAFGWAKAAWAALNSCDEGGAPQNAATMAAKLIRIVDEKSILDIESMCC